MKIMSGETEVLGEGAALSTIKPTPHALTCDRTRTAGNRLSYGIHNRTEPGLVVKSEDLLY
jgi:hypothetical protein